MRIASGGETVAAVVRIVEDQIVVFGSAQNNPEVRRLSAMKVESMEDRLGEDEPFEAEREIDLVDNQSPVTNGCNVVRCNRFAVGPKCPVAIEKAKEYYFSSAQRVFSRRIYLVFSRGRKPTIQRNVMRSPREMKRSGVGK